jgi:hypothetical protein
MQKIVFTLSVIGMITFTTSCDTNQDSSSAVSALANDPTIPSLGGPIAGFHPLYNLSSNYVPGTKTSKTCPGNQTGKVGAGKCRNHIATSVLSGVPEDKSNGVNELKRLQSLNFEIFGIGGVHNGGQIGCLAESKEALVSYLKNSHGVDATNHVHMLHRGFSAAINDHIVFTPWEFQTNYNRIASNFNKSRADLGFMIQRQLFEDDNQVMTALGNRLLNSGSFVRVVRKFNSAENDHMIHASSPKEISGASKENSRLDA